MRARVLLATLLGCAGLLLAPTAASAQSFEDVVDQLNDDGVYVAPDGDGSAGALRSIVREAGDRIDLKVVSLGDDLRDPEGLANDLKDEVGGTVLLFTPSQLAGSSTTFSDAQLSSALDDFAAQGADVESGVEAFVQRLQSFSAVPAPGDGDGTTSTAEPESSSGGGAGGLLIVLVVIVGAIAAFVLFTRSRNRKRVKGEMAERTKVVSAELDAIGTDIYDLADRVKLVENDEATDHYRQGNEQWLELQDRLEKAQSLWEITQVDYAADTAAWHLDAAEALLDGDPIPDEPERPDLTASRPPQRPAEPTPAPRSRQPSPRVEPRTRRRTDWDAPRTRGGGLGDVLSGVLVGSVLRGGGRGRSRAPQRWPGGGSLSDLSRSPGGGRSRGGSASRSRGGSSSRRR